MQAMSPLNKLALLNSNKAQRKQFVLQIIESLENGTADPLEVHIFLKNIEQIFKMLTDEKTGQQYATRYKTMLMDAAEKEAGKSFEKYNAKFQVKEAGTKYDWSACKDVKIALLLDEQKALNEEIEKRQEFLKNVPESGLIMTDESTGETYKIFRPTKTSTTTISVTLS